MSKSRLDKRKRKLNNWLLDFSYRQTAVFIFIVVFLCILSFAVPVICAKTGSSAIVQVCTCGCTAASPSVWNYVAAGLTGLVNALAIISVAIGIYSVAEAKAGSDENAETCRRIEKIEGSLRSVLPSMSEVQQRMKNATLQIGDMYQHMQKMQLQLETVQEGVDKANSRLVDLQYRMPVDCGTASSSEGDFSGESVDRNDL